MDIVNSRLLGAMPIEAGGLSPRYKYEGLAHPAKRQTGYCLAGTHPCSDIDSTTCCPNDEYCYLNSDNQASCCAIGVSCSNNPCATDLVLCTTTTTVSGTASSTTSCCVRPCPVASAFKCASSFGGGCCSVDSTCGISGTSPFCVSTVNPSTSVASVSPTGCPNGQFPCPLDAGGGCCDNGATCTGSPGTKLFCVSGSASTSAVRTGPGGSIESGNITTVPKPHGLSTGARAGIGVGVALGSCLALGAFAWFFVSRRRAKTAQATSMGGANEASGTGVMMSEPSPASRLSPRSPGGTDYFGPLARAGPYTERGTGSVASPQGTDRGVPLSPQGPADIAAPVEIADSKQTPRVPPPPPEYAETTENRFELP